MPIAFVAHFVVLTFIILGCSGSKDDSTSNVVLQHVVARRVNSVSHFEFPLTFYGRVEPRRKSELSFEFAGKLESLLVREGAIVAEGQELARLNLESISAERELLRSRELEEISRLTRLKNGERVETIAAARAHVDRFEAENEQARRHAVRTEKLFAKKATSEGEFEAASFGYKSSQARLEGAQKYLQELESGSREEDVAAQVQRITAIRAEIALLDLKQKKSSLRSPYSAYVIKRCLDEGTVIAAGQSVLEVYEADQYEARISIPTKYISAVTDANAIHMRGSSYPIAARQQIRVLDDNLRTIDFLFEIKASNETELLCGETCTITLLDRHATTAIPVPASALVPSVRGLWSCFRLARLDDTPTDGDTTVLITHKVDVTVLHTDGTTAFVEGELPEGALIVTEGAHKIAPKMRVVVSEDSR